MDNTAIHFRRATGADARPVFEMFRDSVWDYVRRIGLIGADDVQDIDEVWERQGALMEHLRRTAAEDWVAEDRNGRILGMARSIERQGHVELTHFFVAAGNQNRGVGRGLLERAFPVGWGKHRSVIATQNPMALSLYLRFGVTARGVATALSKEPAEVDSPFDLRTEQVGPGERAERFIAAIDEQVLGYRRLEDTRFFLEDRPAFVFRRGNDVIGYLFAGNGNYSGPGAVLDRSDLPALIAHQERVALEAGQASTMITLPLAAAETFTWALNQGYRIDPFYELLLTDAPTIQFDRYLMTQPGFIW